MTEAGRNIREPVVAGSWYPGKAKDLAEAVDRYLEKAEKQDIGHVRALIAPHAGYIYSGQVAAYAYKQIKGRKYSKVIVLAPSHHAAYEGIYITDKTHYRTPLGDVPVSEEANKIGKETGLLTNIPEADLKEHSLEIQLPFLQRTLDSFKLIPIVFGNLSLEEIDKTADVLIKHIDRETLMVASTDLSHYYMYDTAVSIDAVCVNAITQLDLKKASTCEMCGIIPVLVTIDIAKKQGWKTKLLKYSNSGDVTGDVSGVVGYAAIAFYE